MAEEDKKPEEKPAEPTASSEATPTPPDTTSKDGEKEEVVDATSVGGITLPDKDVQHAAPSKEPEKKPNVLKALFKKFGVYILIALLLVVVGVVYIVVKGVSSKNSPKTPAVQNQTLTQSELKDLTNSHTTVGSSSQTLNVQGNTDLTGNVIVKGNLNVAGTIQSGSQLTLTQVKVSGNTSFGAAQISGLQVAQSATFQGVANFSGGMDIAGTSSFTGIVNAASMTATDITLSSNGDIEGHLSLSPPTNAIPGRQVSYGVLGNGGSGSVGGSDTSGTISINSGNNPLPGCFATIIFNIPYNNMPNVMISPVNYGAGATKYYTIVTKTSFKLCTLNAAPKNQAFAYDYFVGATPN